MSRESFIELLRESPVIAAIKQPDELERCLTSESQIVFILCGDLLTITEIVARIQQAGRLAFVHVDLVEGLAARDISVDFIAHTTHADGVISTKPALVRRAKALGLLCVQRFFVLDSLSLANISKQSEVADAIEILPGVMPKVIRKIVALTPKPVIAGGLISDKEDVMGALGAGAVSVSCTNPDVWFL